MPKTKISEFSSTPASNTDIDSINISEGCAPSGINDAIRELMAQLKDFQTGAVGDSFNGPVGTTTAAAGAFTTLSASGAVTLSGGTANGVAYLNGSKVVTSGSALTFDGTNLGIGTASPTTIFNATFSGGAVSGTHSLAFGYPYAANLQLKSTNAGTGVPVASVGLYSNPERGKEFAFYNQADESKSGYLGYVYASGAALVDLTLYNALSGALIFGTNNSEAMRLTSTGLGIGTSSPSAKLHAFSSTAMTQLTVEGTGAIKTGVNFASGGTTYGQIYFDNNSPYDMSVFQQFSTGSLRFGTNNTERARIDSSGNLLVGTTSQLNGTGATISTAGRTSSCTLGIQAHNAAGYNSRIYLECPGSDSAFITFQRSPVRLFASVTTENSGPYVASNGTSWTTNSDRRLKTSIESINHGLASVMALAPKKYAYKNNEEKQCLGFIAQDVVDVIPEVVDAPEDVNEMMGIDYQAIIPVLVKAIQEQQAIIESLKARLDAANL